MLDNVCFCVKLTRWLQSPLIPLDPNWKLHWCVSYTLIYTFMSSNPSLGEISQGPMSRYCTCSTTLCHAKQGSTGQSRLSPLTLLASLILFNVLVFLIIIIISGVQFHISAIHLHLCVFPSNSSAGGEWDGSAGHSSPARAIGGEWTPRWESSQGAAGARRSSRSHPHWAATDSAAGGPARTAAVWGEPGPPGGARQLGPGKRGTETRLRGEKAATNVLHVFLFVCFYGSGLIMSVFVFSPFMQNDKKKIQELSCEVQMKEEWLREERMERERLEVQLGGVQEQNRVSERLW